MSVYHCQRKEKVSSSYLFKYLLKELNIDKEKKLCSAILENMQVYSVCLNLGMVVSYDKNI